MASYVVAWGHSVVAVVSCEVGVPLMEIPACEPPMCEELFCELLAERRGRGSSYTSCDSSICEPYSSWRCDVGSWLRLVVVPVAHVCAVVDVTWCFDVVTRPELPVADLG